MLPRLLVPRCRQIPEAGRWRWEAWPLPVSRWGAVRGPLVGGGAVGLQGPLLVVLGGVAWALGHRQCWHVVRRLPQRLRPISVPVDCCGAGTQSGVGPSVLHPHPGDLAPTPRSLVPGLTIFLAPAGPVCPPRAPPPRAPPPRAGGSVLGRDDGIVPGGLPEALGVGCRGGVEVASGPCPPLGAGLV